MILKARIIVSSIFGDTKGGTGSIPSVDPKNKNGFDHMRYALTVVKVGELLTDPDNVHPGILAAEKSISENMEKHVEVDDRVIKRLVSQREHELRFSAEMLYDSYESWFGDFILNFPH